MKLKGLDLHRSYISKGDDNISKSLINPCLKHAVKYKRSAAYFRSSVLTSVIDGITSLVRNGGTIQLITGQELCQEDIEAISLGYEKREAIIENAFIKAFDEEIRSLDDTNLSVLSELIASGILDIKIALTKDIGIYHDKFGVIEDSNGDKVAFFGSSNETQSGYHTNYEKVRVARSWIEGESYFVIDEVKEFDEIWNGRNEFVEIYDFKSAIKKCVLMVVSERETTKGGNKKFKLRPYQEEAIAAWVKNGYKGFYVMATGTGKTWTAIHSAVELFKKEKAMLVIIAPYKHLVKQWADDVKATFPGTRIVMVSSENPTWPEDISEEIIRGKHKKDHQVIVISTISSFNKERFETVMSASKSERLLIVDEAHRFSTRPDWLKEKYKYLLGLSATPYSGIYKQAGDELMAYFGGQVYDLPIEKALGKFLVNYSYHPIIVGTNDAEEESVGRRLRQMAACFVNGKLVHVEEFICHKRAMLRTISMVQDKTDRIDEILKHVAEKDHFIVYCGDGRLYGEDSTEGLRHIQYIKQRLDAMGHRPAQFTATENMVRRMEIVDAFNAGELTALAAIRCLDEGINIPSIKSALILSSNDSSREFIQRRGRILRQHTDAQGNEKKSAKIYDVVVLPSTGMQKIAVIELRRFYEYARLATNATEMLAEFNKHLSYYGLTLEQITGEVEEDMEELDE